MVKKEIDRDKVMTGKVTRVEDVNIIYKNKRPIKSLKQLRAKVTVKEVKTYRSILFTITSENTGKDLLYCNQTTQYPVLELNKSTDVNSCINADLFINASYNLGPLLKHFGYPKYLSQRQIPEIRKRFFTGRFGMDHCELFGLKEIIPQDFISAKCKEGIVDPKEILIEYKKTLTLDSERVFEPGEEGPIFPIQLMWILDSRGMDKTKDPFKLSLNEEHIYLKRKI